MLQGYQPTGAEIWLCGLYSMHGINERNLENFHIIASIFGVRVIYNAIPSFVFWASDYRIISLDNRTSPDRQRADFYHELGHIALHDGRQPGLHPLMVQLQEWQAQRFQLIAAMPYVLLPPFARTWGEYTWLLSQTFAVPADVAARRVEMIRARRPY